jgi:hypothetical protein
MASNVFGVAGSAGHDHLIIESRAGVTTTGLVIGFLQLEAREYFRGF